MKISFRPVMKKATLLACAISAALLLNFVCGCASTRQTEDLLTAAGFKVHTATTASQQAQLKALPAHKVSTVQKDGKQYYVFPNAARNLYYVGQSAEYEQYQKLRAQEQLAEDQQLNAIDQSQVNFMVSGDW